MHQHGSFVLENSQKSCAANGQAIKDRRDEIPFEWRFLDTLCSKSGQLRSTGC